MSTCPSINVYGQRVLLVFDIKTHGCCIVNRATQDGRVFNQSEQICCESNLYNINKYSCQNGLLTSQSFFNCSSTLIDIASQGCCLTRDSADAVVKVAYQRNETGCCQGNATGADRPTLYDLRTEGCCFEKDAQAGGVKGSVYLKSDKICCNGTLYSASEFVCTALGAVNVKCGTKVIDVITEACCFNKATPSDLVSTPQLYKLADQVCCQNKLFDAKKTVCTSDGPKELIKSVCYRMEPH